MPLHLGQRIRVSVVLLVLITAFLTAFPALASSPDIVISQVYGGGGNSGATYKNDFIELFNRSSAPVDLTGWSVQYASSTGSSWQRTNLSGTLQPGQYYLVQEALGAGGTVSLPAPDATGTIALGATSGKVALVTNTTLLTCGAVAGNCLPNPSIRDFVGFGSAATNFEGSAPTATLSNTTDAMRRASGCTDTDDNGADFTVSAPSPRNTASPIHRCDNQPVTVSCGGPLTTDQGTAATRPVSAVDPDGTVVDIAVSNVTPSSPSISAIDLVPASSLGGTATADVEVGSTTPVGNYTVVVTATNMDSPVTQTGTCSLSVTVNPPLVSISEIQGSGARSPFAGTLRRTSGVVTVLLGSGFFLQDPIGDGDPSTSDGIFVFSGTSTARSLAPGDEVTVTGTVSEFLSSTRPRDLPLTELAGSVTVVKTGSGHALPEPVVISDRPDTVIAPDGIDAFEALEGMLVRITSPRVSGPVNSFGELFVYASGDAANATPGGNLLITPLAGGDVDYNPERILIDDEARLPGGTGSGTRYNNPQVQVRTGDTAAGDIVGAMDYQFSNYRVQASQKLSDILPGTVPASPIASLRAPLAYEGRISTFNVENLFDCVDAPGKDDSPTSCSAADLAALEVKLTKLAAGFQQELRSPEIVTVEEAENTLVLTGDANGYVPGTTIPALLPRLNGHYSAVSFDASDGRGIEVAFIYNTDRVTLHQAFLATDILPDTDGVFDGSAVRSGREPLVGFFTLDGVDLILVGNHLKSKGGPQYTGDATDSGDDPVYGAFQPPVRWTEIVRHLQADYVRRLVDLLLAQHPGANVAVGGDMNDFSFAEPGEGQDTLARMRDSATAPLIDAVDRVPAASRYSYVFEGNSQVLDHLLLNAGMAAHLRDQGIAHINADFPESLGANPAVTFRSSDHDPLVAYFCTDTTPPVLKVTASPSTLWSPNHQQVTVRTTVSLTDNKDSAPALRLVSVTSNEPDNGLGDGDLAGDIVIVNNTTFKLRAERSGMGTGRIYTITYEATDACGNKTVGTAMVNVPRSS
jgi:predicted extracellular nuclease